MPSVLKVNEIQNTQNLTAMTIDSTGRVLTPARPIFSAHTYSGNGSVHEAITAIQWGTVLVNQGSHFNNTTGIWTCPVDGIYSVFLNLNLKVTNTNYLGAYVYQNTTVRGFGWANNTAEAEYDNAVASLFLDCSANDEIVCGYHDTYSLPDSTAGYHQIAISLVG